MPCESEISNKSSKDVPCDSSKLLDQLKGSCPMEN